MVSIKHRLYNQTFLKLNFYLIRLPARMSKISEYVYCLSLDTVCPVYLLLHVILVLHLSLVLMSWTDHVSALKCLSQIADKHELWLP